ncbi:MAG: polysaccharide deacetylase family protein [Pseudonocardiales bacterium]|nr:polysaccharide deacetylase family protein [Pseudonocardiales bacterium]
MNARLAGVAAGCMAAAQLAPAVTAVGAVRRRLTPALAGVGDHSHIAITFDDGPDPRSTPQFLAALRARDTRATFFLLGSALARTPALGRELVASGHEVAVHGWDHRCLAATSPQATLRSLTRARDVIADLTGQRPRWFRPAYGVLTTSALWAAHNLELTPVLWTDWGRDWTRRATPSSVLDTLTRHLDGGACVLMHDADSPTAAPGAWRSTLGALPGLIEHCQRRGIAVGPLADHRPKVDAADGGVLG